MKASHAPSNLRGTTLFSQLTIMKTVDQSEFWRFSSYKDSERQCMVVLKQQDDGTKKAVCRISLKPATARQQARASELAKLHGW